MKRKFLSLMLLTAMAFAVSNTFVSCKDYDDDIKTNAAAITGLQDQLKTLESALQTAKKEAQDAHAEYATKAQLNEVNAAAEAAAKAAAATVKAEAIAEAVAQCKELLNGKADEQALKDLATKVTAIDGSLNTLKVDVDNAKAAIENLKNQVKALEEWKKTVGNGGGVDSEAVNKVKADLEAAIDALKKEVSNLGVEELKSKMKELDQKVSALENGGSNVNVLSVLIDRVLTSISLVPDLYVDGIEAIEFKSLAYRPIKVGTSGYIVMNTKAEPIRIDNGDATATYRLSPNSVDTSKISGYKYLAAIAEKRETRAVSPTCPVAFDGIKSYDPTQGLLTVGLKKTTVESLNRKDGKIWIVALSADWKADTKVASVFSENHMLIEQDYAPQIADLGKFNQSASSNPWDNGKPINQYDPKNKTDYGRHFVDSISVWESWVDENQLVRQEIPYDSIFDLSALVTGCYEREYYLGNDAAPSASAWEVRTKSGHNQLTKDQLESFGIKFQFAIAGWKNRNYEDKANNTVKYVKDVDHTTNQQEFASVTKEGMIISKTPENKYQNRAVIGKEPIVRVDMIDTIRGNVIDQRYFKIKWVAEREKPVPPVTIKIDDDVAVLNCDSMTGEIGWREFIDRVYAVIGEKGLSQEQFETIYPVNRVEVTGLRWTYENNTWKTSGSETYPVNDPRLPQVFPTSNQQGDALIAKWVLYPEDVKRVYFDAVSNTKTFTATVTFKSTRGDYPDITFTWNLKITLPNKLPEINGYYQSYWEDANYDWHYVLPVQYQDVTSPDAQNKAYHLSQFNLNDRPTYADTKYCIYDYPLMEPFTWELEGARTNYIVKNLKLGSCYTYDVQFAQTQDALGGSFKPNYYTLAANKGGDGQYDADGEPDVNWLSCSKVYDAEKSTNNKDYAHNGGYDLLNNNITGDAVDQLAAEMYWVKKTGNIEDDYKETDYIAWGTPAVRDYSKRNARLFLNHKNPANYSMLNPLSDENITTADGMIEPVRTHDKKVKMVVWVALNKWNYIPVKRYAVAIVAPLRINADFGGQFEDGQIHESRIAVAPNLTMTDFRGYVVREIDYTAAELDSLYRTTDYIKEKKQLDYCSALYKYYEVGGMDIDVDNIKYTYDPSNNTSLLETTDLLDSGKYNVTQMYNSHSVDAARLYALTNGNVRLSIDKSADGKELVFRNNGGTNIEHKIYALIPFKVSYGFGVVQNYAAIPIYPGNK